MAQAEDDWDAAGVELVRLPSKKKARRKVAAAVRARDEIASSILDIRQGHDNFIFIFRFIIFELRYVQVIFEFEPRANPQFQIKRSFVAEGKFERSSWGGFSLEPLDSGLGRRQEELEGR